MPIVLLQVNDPQHIMLTFLQSYLFLSVLWVLQSPSVAITVQQSWEYQYYMTVQNLI